MNLKSFHFTVRAPISRYFLSTPHCSTLSSSIPSLAFVSLPSSSLLKRSGSQKQKSQINERPTNLKLEETKVRVREQEEDFSLPNDGSFLFLRLLESLSAQEKENQSHSPRLVATITKAYVPSSPKQTSFSASKVKDSKHIGKEAQSNARAISLPRPRAVLSSPDNDGMIGNRNKMINAERKLPTNFNINRSENRTESPLNIKKASKIASQSKRGVDSSESPLKRRQKAHLGNGKPSSLAI